MAMENPGVDVGLGEPHVGQIVLVPESRDLPPSEELRALYRLSDPSLSELGLNEFLDELLIRVRDALAVDTVAILLLDRETQQLVARAAKGIEEEVEQGVQIPIGKGFAGRIAAERVAIFIADVDHADIMNPILREKGIRSLLGTPLVVEGDLIGVLHVGSLTPRRFDTQDLSVLQIAAARAGPGIERARLFSALEHEHDVAMVLQRSLLPRRLAEVIGISTAVRYLPASDEVGGDWYDVFELPRGRLGVVIGDVVGHGVRAAALMGQLRTALHAYALRDDGPGRVLEQVDRFMQSMPDDAMATAAYAVLDPDRGELALASAGHLPPIVLGGGEARLIEISPAPPLGAMPFGKCPEQNLPLAAGETLVLYTDGLIERRAVPLTDSMAQLLDVVRDATSAEEVCQLAFEELVPAEGVRDDVALVAVRNEEIPTELRLRLPAEARILADMRRALRRWLRHRADAGEQDIVEVTMAVNEACANAIEHAYTPMPAEFELCASFADGEVAVVISDVGHWRSPRGVHRGRGRTIMESAMDGVKVEAGPAGTRVALRRRMRR